jgi:single-strand DNA-binding protein
MNNQVQLIGNMGIDPEITNFESGAKKVRFSLATNEFYTNKTGEKKQKTQWHNVYAWGPTAEYIAKSGKKGRQLAVTGKLTTQKYISKEGKSRTTTGIEVSRAIAL